MIKIRAYCRAAGRPELRARALALLAKRVLGFSPWQLHLKGFEVEGEVNTLGLETLTSHGQAELRNRP